MVENFEHIVDILHGHNRSAADLQFLFSQLLLLNDLRQYIYDLSDAKRQQLLTSLQLEQHAEGHIVFRKGDPSDKLYLILSGQLDMFDEEGRCSTLIATLQAGKMIGERGLVRRTSRMLSAKVRSRCALLTIDERNFRDVLEDAVLQRMEEKLSFVDRYLPCARAMGPVPKERLIYALNMQYFHRGHRLITQGETAGAVLFVFSGECTVTETRLHESKNVVKLSVGSWIGEESVLLYRPSSYDVTVSSEFAWLYSLSHEQAWKLLPETSIDIMKQQCAMKRKNRLRLAKKTEWKQGSTWNADSEGIFHLASPVAKRMLLRTATSRQQRTSMLLDERSNSLREELNEKREIGRIPAKFATPKSQDSTPRSYREYPWSLWKLKKLALTDRSIGRRYAL